jgi:hypothetical protein
MGCRLSRLGWTVIVGEVYNHTFSGRSSCAATSNAYIVISFIVGYHLNISGRKKPSFCVATAGITDIRKNSVSPPVY